MRADQNSHACQRSTKDSKPRLGPANDHLLADLPARSIVLTQQCHQYAMIFNTINTSSQGLTRQGFAIYINVRRNLAR